MKRSEINRTIEQAIAFFREMRFPLPPFAFFTLKDWKRVKSKAREIIELGLGWDITDFGSENFMKSGLLLFTLRNGLKKSRRYAKPYAEKAMIVEPGQVTPMHFHWSKTEDIINRGGGDLVMRLHNSTRNGQLSGSLVTVSVDGISRKIRPGSVVRLKPGESICLTTGLYHTFQADKKKTFVAEVSCVNDDETDNRFYEPAGRFPEISEDEPPLHLTCGDYARFLKG